MTAFHEYASATPRSVRRKLSPMYADTECCVQLGMRLQYIACCWTDRPSSQFQKPRKSHRYTTGLNFASEICFDDVLDVREKGVLAELHRQHEINRQSTWGTEKEIFVIATMLQLEIFVFTGITRGSRGWARFWPIFSKPTCMPRCGFKIFLYDNRSGDHYDCVIPSQ